MTILYDIAILLYAFSIRVAALFNGKARLFVQGRRNWREKLAAQIDDRERYLWFHCASLGEFEQGRPVIEEIRRLFPEYKIVLSFFSPSGYEIRKNYEVADVVCYLPIDSRKNVNAFLNLVHPEKAFFIKYEYWYHFISGLKRRNIPVYLISAIFRENQPFFRKGFAGRWFRNLLFRFEHIFIQDENSAELLKSVGISNFTVSGDTRFDRVYAIANGSKKIPEVEKFRGNSPLIVAGSTWKPDEELLAAFINNSKGIKFIIAPHEVAPANINRISQLLKTPPLLFSQIAENHMNRSDVLIIDSIGILSSVYRYGSIAYIGGGFGVGIHNILEAATFGLPVIFGPNYKKFKEAVDLVKLNGAFSINNQTELEQTLNRLITDEDFRKKSSGTCKNYVEKNTGSTKLIIKKVFNIPPVLD